MTDARPLVHRAVYGDVGGSHNLVAASNGAPTGELGELAAYTDRLLPTEIAWSAYLCGFPYGSHYVLTRTFPVRASRAGMVQTHAVLLPLEATCVFPALDELALLLPVEPDLALTRSTSVVAASFPDLPKEPASVSSPPIGYPAVVGALLSGVTPVWLGLEGFEEVVWFLWRRLWPDARREFRFRVSAEPKDLDALPATIVCSPNSQRVHWPPKYLLDQRLERPQEGSLVESLLLGLPGGDPILEAQRRLHVAISSVQGLRRIEQYVNFLASDTAESVRAAARILGAMSPSADDAGPEKRRVIALLAEKTASGSEDDALGLRNLSTAPFPTAASELRRALARWLQARVDVGHGGVSFARQVFLVANPWQGLARSAVADVFGHWRRECAVLLWHWWREEPLLARYADSMLPIQPELQAETDVVSTAPSSIEASLRGALLAVARTRHWARLHAEVLANSPDLEVVDKLRAQLDCDRQAHTDAGLAHLADRIGGRELVDAVVAMSEPALIKYACSATLLSPGLLVALNPASPMWRSIWLARIQSGCAVFEGIVQAGQAAHALMDAQFNQAGGIGQLLDLVVIEERAELATYPRRAELLGTLSESVALEARKRAASSWLAALCRDPSFDAAAADGEFSAAIVAHWRQNRQELSAAVVTVFFGRFSDLVDPGDLMAWLEESQAGLPVLAMVAIGQLVAERRWTSVAQRLVELALGARADLTAVARACVGLLSFWQKARFLLSAGTPTTALDEWWAALHEVAVELYPRGVDQWNIWERAAGDEGRVRGDDGWEEWGWGLRMLRNGGGGDMTVEGLLHQMRVDFSRNPKLQTLEQIYLAQLAGRSYRKGSA